MQITPAELGKFKAIIHHFEKLQDSFEVLSVILAEDDPRLGNLSRLKKHVAFFSEKFERDEAEKIAKKKREEDQRQLDIVRLGLALQTFFPKAFPIEAERSFHSLPASIITSSTSSMQASMLFLVSK
ncbi:hypothetical protein PP938_gp096 [Rhizobium phage AF3]|uniref:Uncharacterized protein n=1 Tax=Rhizobium phage AF3 TaxID=2763529 RepID=A0A7G7WW94_9CAUD|nr:hypothetical protein PP938_gp096 [Rhizobium phage AF3]QNH71488.1 hypothetical protein AF3_096 [Rhizobium phage AF3]